VKLDIKHFCEVIMTIKYCANALTITKTGVGLPTLMVTKTAMTINKFHRCKSYKWFNGNNHISLYTSDRCSNLRRALPASEKAHAERETTTTHRLLTEVMRVISLSIYLRLYFVQPLYLPNKTHMPDMFQAEW